MSIQRLNQVLIHKILWHILDHSGPRKSVGKEYAWLATISRDWQAVIEPLTFGELSLTQHDLADAARIVTPARQTFVGTVNLNIILDDYDEEARWRVESPAEQQRNSEVFTAAVRNVMHLVKNWKRTHGSGLRMCLNVWSPSDINRLSVEAAEALVQRLPFSPLRRYEASLIRFLNSTDTLPKINHVDHLEIQRYWLPQGRHLYRAIDVASASLVISHFGSKLNYLSLHLVDWPRGALEERKRRRKHVAVAIDKLRWSLGRLRFSYFGSPPRDENCCPPSLLDPSETEDALSLSLRRFWRRPTTQNLDVYNTILGQEFFWPENAGSPEEKKREQRRNNRRLRNYGSWEKEPCLYLENLRVQWPIVTPDGRWLCSRSTGEDAWEERDVRALTAGPTTDLDMGLDDPAYTNKHRFRLVPIPDVVNPLLKAMARAMGQMPALSDFEWKHPGGWPGPQHRIQFNPDWGKGGGRLEFHGFGIYDDDGERVDTGEPPVDEDVVQAFVEALESAKEIKGEVKVIYDWPSDEEDEAGEGSEAARPGTSRAASPVQDA